MLRDLDSLRDMALAARRVLRYVKNVDQQDFDQDLEKQDSIIYRILILGEASKHISVEFQEKHQDIPWRQIAGMRNMLVHEYDQIDLEILWDVTQTSIPDLLAKLHLVLQQNEAPFPTDHE
jgi:uncharacterized protein with HEPN domain